MRIREQTTQTAEDVVLSSRAPIRRNGDSEIVFSSETDEALTLFVSFPKSKREILKGRAAPTEPARRP